LTTPMQSIAAPKSHRHVSATQRSHSATKSAIHARVRQHARLVQLQKRRAYELGETYDGSSALQLASSKALILNQNTGEVVYAKNTNLSTPIASITKLMTAMVMLDANLPLDEKIEVTEEDVDYLKGSSSRLPIGSVLSRGDMLHIALMASENRAASAIGRNYPGGLAAFVAAMNAKAQSLGMKNSHFVDSTGLESENVSTAEDLVKMVQAAYVYPEIRLATTSPSHDVYISDREYPTSFKNTNGLVRKGEWDIGLSKTGYISEAGRCLVMQAKIAGEPMILVLLDSNGKLTRIGDANRIRKWVEYNTSTTTGETNTQVPTASVRKVS
jgi:serine-type D-Ala-D-Ala endopeptidase (penicillin-binding protein 7)